MSIGEVKPMSTFAGRLKKLRMESNLLQKELADRINYSPPQVVVVLHLGIIWHIPALGGKCGK